MGKQAVVVRRGEGEALNAMGAGVRFVCPSENTGKGWSMMEVSAPRHVGPPPHHHPWDEAYYVIEGELRFGVDGREVLLKSGDFLYAPGGTVHSFQGASEQPARVLIFDAPAHAESFFRDVDREVKEMPRDLPKALEIGARHRIHFVR